MSVSLFVKERLPYQLQLVFSFLQTIECKNFALQSREIYQSTGFPIKDALLLKYSKTFSIILPFLSSLSRSIKNMVMRKGRPFWETL